MFALVSAVFRDSHASSEGGIRAPIRCRFSLRGNDATVSLLLPAELCSFREANYFINEKAWAYLGRAYAAAAALVQGI